MNKNLTNLALQIGGSHYPAVSRAHLPLTVKLVANNAVQILRLNGYDDAAECLETYFKEFTSEGLSK